jgi:TrmH family RNA methyltransferase
VAALKEDASAVDASALEQVFQGPVALMIGNEGAGLGEDWVRMADWKVTIPCPGFVESLNAAVAGSILLWEVARRRSPKTGAS